MRLFLPLSSVRRQKWPLTLDVTKTQVLPNQDY